MKSKIRGQRIDTRQVEAQTVQHAQIGQCLVTGVLTSEGTQLTLYYVLNSAEKVSQSQLRDWLACSLPDYMVPTLYCELEALPRLPNGKLNRHALPQPNSQSSDEFVAPRSSLEGALADIFKSVLNLEQVSIKDNFFNLGGHSLMATKLVALINQKLDCDLNVRQVFTHSTVMQLAQLIDDGRLISELIFDTDDSLDEGEEELVL